VKLKDDVMIVVWLLCWLAAFVLLLLAVLPAWAWR
jgi:hypothetical protein